MDMIFDAMLIHAMFAERRTGSLTLVPIDACIYGFIDSSEMTIPRACFEIAF